MFLQRLLKSVAGNFLENSFKSQLESTKFENQCTEREC